MATQEHNENLRQATDKAYQSFRLSKEERQNWYRLINRRGDRWMAFAIALSFLLGCFFAASNDTWKEALAIGGGVAAVYLVLRITSRKKPWHRFWGSAALGVFSALFLHQLNALPQTYFFPVLAALVVISYEDWKLILPLGGVVGVHAVLFAWLQYDGVEGVMYTRSPAGYMGSYTFLFHLGLNALMIFLCAFWAGTLQKRGLEGWRRRKFLDMQMAKVEGNIALARSIAEGNLDSEVAAAEDDALHDSLLEMRGSLKDARDKEQQERFVNVGLATIGELLREYELDFETLSAKLVSSLVSYYKANQGGLFVLEEGVGADHLELVAFYAYERLKYANRRVKVGEGLVGQTFREGRTIHLTEIPEGYITVTSGLGHATPDTLVLVPLMLNEEIYGVLEIASFHAFEPFHLELLEKLTESMASAISNHRNSAYTKKLLAESQELAEQMRSQEEEMRQNMEELQATQEEMARKEKVREEELNVLKTEHQKQLAVLEESQEEMEKSLSEFQEFSEKQMQEQAQLEAEVTALKDQLKGSSGR